MKHLFNLSLIIWLMLQVCMSISCSNEETKIKKEDDVRSIDFQLTFADYGEEAEIKGTRGVTSPDLLKDTVSLSGNLGAEICIQKDTASTRKLNASTRSVPTDTYTILAYQGGVLKGILSGTIAGSQFTPDPSGARVMLLAPGSYDFVCYNSKVSRTGNSLIVNHADAETALIGRATNVSISGYKRPISLVMNHVGARLRVKVQGYMTFSDITAIVSDAGGNIPIQAVYNAVAGTYSYNYGSVAANYSFLRVASGMAGDYTYSRICKEYRYFLPGTVGGDMKITFTSGTIYNENMTGGSTRFNPSPAFTMKENGSYIVNIKLLYNYLYLFSDGSQGLLQDNPGKIPVGLIVSRGHRLAMALKDSGRYAWSRTNTQKNSFMYGDSWDILNDMQGEHWTWNAGGSLNGVIKANDAYTTPAFNAAASYSSRVNVTGPLVGRRWFLPSLGHWKLLFTNIGFGTIGALPPNIRYNTRFPYNSLMVNVALAQAGGDPFVNAGAMWSSSEVRQDMVALFIPRPDDDNAVFSVQVNSKPMHYGVRAFITY